MHNLDRGRWIVCPVSRAEDPDSDSAFQVNPEKDPIWIHGFDDQKLILDFQLLITYFSPATYLKLTNLKKWLN
jgi:hypothetical protein